MISVNKIIISNDILFKKKYNLKKLLNDLNNPQNNFKVVNVVGTNGKGSTATLIYKNLVKNNIDAGLFFSPAFLYHNERIQVNDKLICDDRLLALIQENKDLIKKYELTFFEIWTFLAILYFNEKKIKIAIVEAGIGGVKDATNVFENQLAVCLTSLGYDHTDILGTDIEDIIRNKVQIAKNDAKIYTSSNNKIYINKIKQYTPNEIIFCDDYSTDTTFQKYNKAIACVFLKSLNIIFDENVTLPLGRQTVLNKEPLFIIDGCHNLNGAIELIKSIKEFKDLTVLFASSIGKENHEMMNVIKKECKEFFITTFDHEKAWDFKKVNYENKVDDWKKFILKNKQKKILVCGSLYFIPQVYEWYVGEK